MQDGGKCFGVRALRSPLAVEDFEGLLSSYTTEHRYTVSKEPSDITFYRNTSGEGRDADIAPLKVSFTMELERLEVPREVKEWIPSQEDVDRYNNALSQGLSYGAFAWGEGGEGEKLVGLVVAEYREWNNMVWLWEVSVHREWRRKGVAAQLIQALVASARDTYAASMIVGETQAINVPAIRFYLQQGFRFDGIDVSYYREDGLEQQDIAVFVKLPLNRDRVHN